MQFTTLFFATLLGLTAAAPASAAGDLPCPTGWTQYNLNFNGLGKNIDGKTHGLPKPGYLLGELYWAPTDWQVVSPGLAQVVNGFHRPNNFTMTTNSGQGALVTCQEKAKLNPPQSGQQINLQSFWIRHQEAGAFKLQIVCNRWLTKPEGHWVTSATNVSVPAQAYGKYYKVQLTAAQQRKLSNAEDCTMQVTPQVFCPADPPQPCWGDKALLIDDLRYCFKPKDVK